MPIKRRKHRPDPTTVHATEHEDRREEARHPHLTGLRQDVYWFVQHNPNCTRDDVSRGLGVKSSTITARIKELIDEGYIIEPPNMRKANRSGVRSKVLHVSDRPMGGKPLDQVRVEVELTIDCNGNYGARAYVVDGLRQTGTAVPILSKKITLTAPHPSTYQSMLSDEKVTTVSRSELQYHADNIVDADYTVLD